MSDLLSIINAFCINTEIGADIPPSAVRDVKDLYLLSLAKTVGADYIISGDADLTDIKHYEKTQIIRFEEFQQIMEVS